LCSRGSTGTNVQTTWQWPWPGRMQCVRDEGSGVLGVRLWLWSHPTWVSLLPTNQFHRDLFRYSIFQKRKLEGKYAFTPKSSLLYTGKTSNQKSRCPYCQLWAELKPLKLSEPLQNRDRNNDCSIGLFEDKITA
jgi:hypothetical protein